MNIYIFDNKKGRTEIIEIDESRIADNPDLEFFNDNNIRKVWHSGEEEWYLSIVDVVYFLTDSKDPKQYIKKMRQRDKELSDKWGTICTPLQMLAPDGKMRKTQAANIEGILRIIQSISSSKAEPFKIWLAKVGAERLDEIADPEKAMQRDQQGTGAAGLGTLYSCVQGREQISCLCHSLCSGSVYETAGT